MKNSLKTFIILIIIFSLISIAVALNSPTLNYLDQQIGKIFFLNDNTTLINISIFFTKIVDPINSIIIIVILSLISFLRKKKYDMYLIFISSGLALSLSSALKILFARARPLYSLVNETTMSFPSNHAVISAIFLCFFLYIISENIKKVFIKKLLKILTFAVFIFIPLTRIMLGAHFASDVIAGFVLGLIIYLFTGMLLSTTTEGKADCDVCLKEKNVL